MKIIELLRFNKEIRKRMSLNNIRTDDWEYVEMFNEYEQMRNAGEKITWIVSALADKYECSESSVHRIISRFKNDVKN